MNKELKPCDIKIVHTPVRLEVCNPNDVRIVEKQRDKLFNILEDIYNSRGEMDKLNCKIMRIKSILDEIVLYREIQPHRS